MPDMLVKLYDLPDAATAAARLSDTTIAIRRCLLPEKPQVLGWMLEHFPAWAPEMEATFARMPISSFLALRDGRIIGFACTDAFCRNYFGPTAVIESERGRGVGRALLLAALHAQREQGYAYSIIGGVGPAAFYERNVGAIAIPDSAPGAYAGMLRAQPKA